MVLSQQKVDGDWYDDTVQWNDRVWSSLQISAKGLSSITTINKGVWGMGVALSCYKDGSLTIKDKNKYSNHWTKTIHNSVFYCILVYKNGKRMMEHNINT